jgi:hypothetical protein
MDLSTDLDHRLVARQMRRAVLRYMASPAFQPSVDVDLATLRVLATPKQPKRS